MRCIIGGMRGPVILILLGLLFLFDRWGWHFGGYSVRQFWPVLLIAFGFLKVAEALAPAEGHVGN